MGGGRWEVLGGNEIVAVMFYVCHETGHYVFVAVIATAAVAIAIAGVHAVAMPPRPPRPSCWQCPFSAASK